MWEGRFSRIQQGSAGFSSGFLSSRLRRFKKVTRRHSRDKKRIMEATPLPILTPTEGKWYKQVIKHIIEYLIHL